MVHKWEKSGDENGKDSTEDEEARNHDNEAEDGEKPEDKDATSLSSNVHIWERVGHSVVKDWAFGIHSLDFICFASFSR